MILSYAACAASNKKINAKFVKLRSDLDFRYLEPYDRCSNMHCMFCNQKQHRPDDTLKIENFSQEIRKIPYKMMCKSIGMTSAETNYLMKIPSNKAFIQDGFDVEDFTIFRYDPSYYTKGYCDCIKQLVKPANFMNPINYSPAVDCNRNLRTPAKKKQPKLLSTGDETTTSPMQPIISTLRSEDPYYFSINNIVYGDLGKSIPKWKTQEFCAAAEEYALYGHLQIESDFKPTKSELKNFFPKYLNDDSNCGINIHKNSENVESVGQQAIAASRTSPTNAFQFDPSILKIGSKVAPTNSELSATQNQVLQNAQSSLNVQQYQQHQQQMLACIGLKPQHFGAILAPFIPMPPPLHPAPQPPQHTYNQSHTFFPSSPHHQITTGGFYFVSQYMHPQHHHQRSNLYRPAYVEQAQNSTKRLPCNDDLKGTATGNESQSSTVSNVIDSCNKFLEDVESYGLKVERSNSSRKN